MEIAASNVDTQYLHLLENILNYGVLKHNRTGVDTLSLIHQSMSLNLETEFPILQSKKVFYKSSIKELLCYHTQYQITALYLHRIHHRLSIRLFHSMILPK